MDATQRQGYASFQQDGHLRITKQAGRKSPCLSASSVYVRLLTVVDNFTTSDLLPQTWFLKKIQLFKNDR